MKSVFIVLLTLMGLGTYAVAADANATAAGGEKTNRAIRYPARPLWMGRAAADPGASRWMSVSYTHLTLPTILLV